MEAASDSRHPRRAAQGRGHQAIRTAQTCTQSRAAAGSGRQGRRGDGARGHQQWNPAGGRRRWWATQSRARDFKNIQPTTKGGEKVLDKYARAVRWLCGHEARPTDAPGNEQVGCSRCAKDSAAALPYVMVLVKGPERSCRCGRRSTSSRTAPADASKGDTVAVEKSSSGTARNIRSASTARWCRQHTRR